MLPLTLLIKFYGYISIVFVLLLSCSVVTAPNLLLSFEGITIHLSNTCIIIIIIIVLMYLIGLIYMMTVASAYSSH
jgi:hypothetical protein